MKKFLPLFLLIFSINIYAQPIFSSNQFSDDFEDGQIHYGNNGYWWGGSCYTLSESNGKLQIDALNADKNYNSFGLMLDSPQPINIEQSKSVSFNITNQGNEVVCLKVNLILNDPLFINPCSGFGDSLLHANVTPDTLWYKVIVQPGETKNALINFSGALSEYGYHCSSIQYYKIQNFSDIKGLMFVVNGGAGETYCTWEGCNPFSGRILIDDLIIGAPVDPSKYNFIKGYVLDDKNRDCVKQSIESGIPNILVKATPGPFYAVTNSSGEYELIVDTGTVNYTVEQIISQQNQDFISKLCPTASHSVNLDGNGKEAANINFYNQVRYCHRLHVEVGSTRRRRCFRNSTSVTYFNDGTIAANNVQINVEFPEYVVPISSTPPWTSLNGKIATYKIGSLNAFSNGIINIVDSVVCWNEDIRNLTQCTKASISPALGCNIDNPSWDKSSIKVVGRCDGDSAKFTITNTGSDMQGTSQYRVYLNDTLIYTGNFMLPSNHFLTIGVFGGGNTIRLEADQRPYHPGRSRPRETVEACGGNLETAPRFLVMTAPPDDQDEFVSISCLPIIDSYDPNDKLAIPMGYLDEHYIPTSTEKIEYTIRFQNTGSDTAFKVVVVDSLNSLFDISSLEVLGASHPFKWTLSGGENPFLTFTFNNINLPDSTTDNPGSNGFVKFAVSFLPGIAEGMNVSNKAEIFFDYNSAIVTNLYEHIFSDQVFEDLSKGNNVKEGNVNPLTPPLITPLFKVYPNPATNLVTFSHNTNEPYTVIIFNSSGQKVMTKNVNGANTVFDISDLQNGIYFYEIRSSKIAPVKGRIVKM